MKDFLNREIQVGDKIVYPGRMGSSMWLNYAEVKAVKGNKLVVSREITTERWNSKLEKFDKPVTKMKDITIYCTDRVVVVNDG